jgi:hypothetical protein
MTAKVQIDIITNSSGAKRDMGSFANSITELQSKIGLAREAFEAVANVWEQTAGFVMEYDDQVKKLSLDLGISSDEASRIIGVSRTYGITVEQVTSALDMMVKRGTAPSIDTLAKLSDEFLSIKDPVERAAKMSELLGRNWTSLNELLEKGGDNIRAVAESLPPGTIRTKEQTEAAEDLSISWNQLTLKMDAWRVSVFSNVIPAMVAILQATDKINAALNLHAVDVTQTSKSYEDYVEEMNRAALAAGLVVGPTGELITKNRQLVQSHYILTNAEWAAARAMDAIKKGTEQATKSDWDYAGVGQRLIIETLEKNDALHNSAAQLEAERVAGEQNTAMMGNLAAAQDNLSKAQQSFNQGVGSDLVNMLDQAGIKGQAYNDALGVIDTHLGTNYKAANDMKIALQGAIDNYKKTGDLGTFGTAIDGVITKFQAQDAQVAISMQKVKDLQTEIDNLHGKDVHIGIIIDQNPTTAQTDPTHNTGGQGAGGGKADQQYASGISDAPGGLAVVGEQGPEVVNLPQHSQVIPNSALGGVNFNGPVTLSLPNVTNYQQFKDQLAQEVHSARKSGKGYSGTR